MDPIGLPNSFKYEFLKNDGVIIMRSNLNCMEDITKWINEYKRNTNTNWTVRKSHPIGLRILCSKQFVCHHNSYRKIDEAFRRKGVCKDSGCKAYIKITIKLDTKNTRKKDQYVKKGLGAIIELNNVHNHDLNTAAVLRFLPPDDCKETFFEYFSDGMGVAESCKYHEEMLFSMETFDVRQLANCRINPTKGTVYYWHNEWRMKNVGPAGVTEKKKSASNSPRKGEKIKRKRFNSPSSQPETILPHAESSTIHTDPSTSSLFDSNIVIKQEIIETDDEVPNDRTLDMDHLNNTLLPPEMIKQEKSPNASTVLPNPLITNHSSILSDRIRDLPSENSRFDSSFPLIIRVCDSDLLLSPRELENTTYNIVNFPTNLPRISSSSCSTVSVNESKVTDTKACSETLSPTSVDGKVKDQFDAYGEYIAAKLRKLDPKSCAYVQKAFGEIIFEAEMGKFLLRNDLPITS